MKIITKVKSVQPTGTWESQHGLFYKFEYQMEDGSVVVANHKTEQCPFKQGDEVEYEITNTQYNNGKVSKPDMNPQQPSGQSIPVPQQSNSDPRQKSIEMQVCLKEANNFHCHHGFETDNRVKEVSDTAKALYVYTFIQ